MKSCSEFPTSLCHNIVDLPFFSIFFVMLTKLGPFQGHHLFLKEKYSMKSCIYLSSSQERPKQTKKKANFYFLNCFEFPTSLCHNIVPLFSIFFVMLKKLGPFQGHHLFLKEKYSMKSCSYLWISTPSTVADPGFSPGWGVNPPSVTQLCQIFPRTA